MTDIERTPEAIHIRISDHPWDMLLQYSPDIAYIVSAEGVYLEVNPGLCNALRVARDRLIGSRMADRLLPDQVAVAARVLREIGTRKTAERSTRTYRVAGDETKTFEVMECPLIRGGEVWAVGGIGRDVSQEVILEHKLWDMGDSRRAAVDFSLRTSLGLIKGYIYTMRRYGDLSDFQRQRYMQVIEDEVDHLASTIENILDVQRLEGTELEMTRDIVDLADCVRLSLAHCKEESDRRHVLMKCDLPATISPTYAPREAVCRVIVNLLQNAILHTLHSGEVFASLREDETYFEISVRDKGVGIPESDMPYIFDKFYRGAGSAATAMQGSGMGLAIVRLLVEAMGGRISVRSKVGQGSEFQVVLPKWPVGSEDWGETQPLAESSVVGDAPRA